MRFELSFVAVALLATAALASSPTTAPATTLAVGTASAPAVTPTPAPVVVPVAAPTATPAAAPAAASKAPATKAAATDEAPAARTARPETQMSLAIAITIFVLSMLLGTELIRKVPTQLHTPLMSGSNAISGVTIIGALLAASFGGGLGWTFGMLAVVAAMINVVGGYLVTDRMLAMFKRK